MKKFFLLAFVLASLAELLSGFMGAESIHFVAKPLLMITLALYYFSSTDHETRSRTVLLAILCSLVGDVLLLNDDYFIGGLVAFLVAHVLYIIAFRKHRYEETENALQGIQRIRMAFPIILAGTGLVVVLYPVLGDMRIPVMIYATVIVLMAMNALFRYGRTNSPSFWLTFSGAVLFMTSDSILAINKFLMPLSYASFSIMLTYVLAQFMIVEGLRRHD
jgi:uncharacterized membrane protein YhhN